MLPGISEIIETLQYNYRRRQNGEKMEKTEYDYLKQKKILLADDEEQLRDMVVSILAQEGYTRVRTAGSVGEALRAAEEWKPEFAILDVMLPDGDGFALLEKMRELADIPVLFLTARGEEEDKFRGFGLGADDYVVNSSYTSL